MESKNYTEVMIAGKLYTVAGFEEQNYLQRVASYINDKWEQLKRQERFLRQSTDYQNVLLELNIADDYFKAQRKASILEVRAAEMEKEIYNLKHELVATQIKLEKAVKEAEDWQFEVERMERIERERLEKKKKK